MGLRKRSGSHQRGTAALGNARIWQHLSVVLACPVLLSACGGASSPAPPVAVTPRPSPSPAPTTPATALTQAYAWQRAVAITGDMPVVRGVANGPQGSFYIAGSFRSGAALSIGSVTALPAGGGQELFVARLDEEGNPLWVRVVGGAGDDYAFDVASDASGNAIVTGQVSGTVSLLGTTYVAAGEDAVTFKLDQSGNLRWASFVGGAGDAYGNEVAVAPNGDIAITGPYSGTGEIESTTLPMPSGATDIFVARYTADGRLRSSSTLRGPGDARFLTLMPEAGRGIGFDGDNRLLLAGAFSQSLAPSGGAALQSTGGTDCFLIRYGQNDAVELAHAFGGSGDDKCRGVGGDNFGAVLVAGTFTRTANLAGQAASSRGSDDLFLAALDSGGNTSWLTTLGSPSSEEGSEIDVSPGGEAAFAASFSATLALDGTSSLSSLGARDILLGEYDAAGRLIAALAGGGSGDDVAYALARIEGGAMAVVGTVGASASFGAQTINAGGGQAGFVAIARPSLPTGTPGASGALNTAAAAAYAFDNGTRAMVVIENGAVTFERYAGAGSASRGEFLASGTKSFACALAAAGEEDGFFSLDDFASTGIAPWRSGGSAPDIASKQKIRAANLLSLSGGLANSGQSGLGLNSVDSYAQAINARSSFDPDVAMIYGPNSFQAFLAFFELRTGGTLGANGEISGGRDPLTYLQAGVFDRIGIAPTAWLRDARGKPNFGGGASFRAVDWARYGQFILQNGQWNGQQIISAARIRRCATYESPAFRGYGLGFFLNRPVGATYQPGQDSIPFPQEVRDSWAAGGKIAPDAPDSMMMAYGAGNMKMFILPSHNAVIVKLAGNADDNRFLGLLLNSSQ